jgi:hypothetical protein
MKSRLGIARRRSAQRALIVANQKLARNGARKTVNPQTS